MGRLLRTFLSLAVAVGILAVALPVAFGSGAQAGTSPVQVFSSDSLLVPEAAGSAQLSISGLIPGQSRSATIRVANRGSASAIFSLAARLADRPGSGGAALSSVLRLRIERAGSGATVYSGPVGSMPRLPLGEIGAAGERAYRFTITLPGSAGNEVQGSALSARFVWVSSQ